MNESKHIKEIEKKHKQELAQLKRQFEIRLSQINKVHQKQIDVERNIILNSWRWRIGNVIVTIYDRVNYFLKGIIRIITRGFFNQNTGQSIQTPIKNSNKSNFKTVKSINDPNKPTLVCIFDTFTHSCFSPEFNIINPYPNNWKYVFKNNLVDAFFCESAWRGQGSAWQFHFGKLGEKKKNGLLDMVRACQKKGIPTIFWNKEDPIHFDHFIDDAKLFDFIFTTDESIIPKYKRHVDHNNIYSLPFAAQERIHNPIRTEARDKTICFAGTYYNTKYAERILDMEMILKIAMNYGLEIFDRNYGATGYEKVMYGFPEIYKPYIKGRLTYSDMVKAYKKYKVFLNINSVRYSPTMLARRVYELLACGTPVISTYSEAIINLLGEDTVLIANTEEEARQHIEKLLNDEGFWWFRSLRGLRKVMDDHTYNQRSKEIFDIVGLDYQINALPRFYVIARISSVDDAHYLKEILDNQTYRDFEVLLIASQKNEIAFNETNQLGQLFGSMSITISYDNPELLQKIIASKTKCNYAAIMKIKDYYGPEYLHDFALAIQYSGARILGKYSCFHINNQQLSLLHKGQEYQYTTSLFTSSMIVEVDCFMTLNYNELINKEIFTNNEYQMFATDPYNLLLNGRKADAGKKALVIL